VLEIHDGDVELRPGGGDANAAAICDSAETLAAIVRGELNPVVAALQDRLQLRGDLAFAVNVILGVQVAPRRASAPPAAGAKKGG